MKHANRTHTIVRLILLSVVVALATISLTRIAYVLHQNSLVYDSKVFNATFYVGKGLGLSADQDELNFGMVLRGGSSQKELVLYHEYIRPLKVVFAYSGSIAEVLSPIDEFYLEPYVEKKINLIARAGNEYRNYTGTVIIKYLK